LHLRRSSKLSLSKVKPKPYRCNALLPFDNRAIRWHNHIPSDKPLPLPRNPVRKRMRNRMHVVVVR
uniref:THAP-type domain-containing protein n=1 Tax=Gongylonema pulchrum TaxID=637853 RepID=A0A183DEU6_9BILA